MPSIYYLHYICCFFSCIQLHDSCVEDCRIATRKVDKLIQSEEEQWNRDDNVVLNKCPLKHDDEIMRNIKISVYRCLFLLFLLTSWIAFVQETLRLRFRLRFRLRLVIFIHFIECEGVQEKKTARTQSYIIWIVIAETILHPFKRKRTHWIK